MATITFLEQTDMFQFSNAIPTVIGNVTGFQVQSGNAKVFIYGTAVTAVSITATDFIFDTGDATEHPNFIVSGALIPITPATASNMFTVLDWALAGFDRIIGSPGADTLAGGAGNDTFVVTAGDVINDFSTGIGFDWVESSTINLNLASYNAVENAKLTGVIGLTATGNDGANIIDGSTNSAANALTGLGGNDTYIVDTRDTVSEAAGAAGGTDLVQSASKSLSLTSYVNVEDAQLLGGGAFSLTGSGVRNVLIGNAGSNVIAGGGGNDVLKGGTGADYFVFNTAPNATTNRDSITDFFAPSDTIRLENAIFTGLGTATGAIAAGKFWSSATGLAHDADDRIIYNTGTGVLTYDSNGNAAGGAVAFATLTTKPAITAADFVVI